MDLFLKMFVLYSIDFYFPYFVLLHRHDHHLNVYLYSMKKIHLFDVFAEIFQITGHSVMPKHQIRHNQGVFRDLLHKGAGHTGHQTLTDKGGSKSIVDELPHHAVISCEDTVGDYVVAAVPEIEAFFPVGAVLNRFLNTVF